MKPLIRTFLFFLMLCWSAGGAVAQKTNAQPLKVTFDSSKVTVKPIDKEALKTLKAEEAFIYTETPPAELSLWDRFWQWVWEKLNASLRYANNNAILKYTLLALFAGIFMYTLYRILWKNNMLAAGTLKNNMAYDVIPEDIHLINYEQEIALLIKETNYRLAVRLLYLRSLKQLSDKQFIHWQPGKTNYAYVNEVGKDVLKGPFRTLTRQFDYIWYGHFPIDAQAFEPLHQSFNAFNKLLK